MHIDKFFIENLPIHFKERMIEMDDTKLEFLKILSEDEDKEISDLAKKRIDGCIVRKW